MNKRAKKLTAAKAKAPTREKVPLIEHLKELRRRLFYVAVCVAVGSAVAYALEQKLIAILLRPSHGQSFIYTSPLGGINFLFGICLDIGLVLATPIIIYQLLAFLSPLIRDATHKFLLLSSAAAGLVALGGVAFGYYIGLPSALHFLLHQFVDVQIRPLITIQSYISFVGLYLFGSALMFQLPLVLLIINRIRPLTPGGLFKYERHLTVFAFVTAFIMNPTPNIIDQMLVVVPIIMMYQVGIGLIWAVNKKAKPGRVQRLREADLARQAERAARELRALQFASPLPPLEQDSSDLKANQHLAPLDSPQSAQELTSSYTPLRRQLVQ